SLGTSGTLYGYADRPVIDPQGRVAAFCSSTGGWLPLVCTMNCTVATELTRRLFDIELPRVAETAARAPAGSERIITLPFYNGERTPNLPAGRGSVTGLTPDNFKKENLLRSSMEAAVMGLKNGLQAFRQCGFAPSEIRLIGGGARNPLWRQLAADIMELPVVLPAGEEAAALGAALQALWCSEKQAGREAAISTVVREHVKLDKTAGCTPDKENAAVYRSLYADYSRYLEALSPLFQ
ncbi:MAG TPA: FGGY-family carbohydrate kinase, partial [Spirochaetota bacterium]|nr:FGGY-family carbohydrate kinase [Spirochaetota bacterium]